MNGSRVAYYLVLAVLTAAAFASGWLLRGRTAERDGGATGVVSDAADAAWSLELLATRDLKAAHSLALRRMELAVRNLGEAARRGARVEAPLDRQEVVGALRRVASWAHLHGEPDLKKLADDARKDLTDTAP